MTQKMQCLLTCTSYRAITPIGFQVPEAPIACLFPNACLLEIGPSWTDFSRKHFFGLYAPLGGHPSHAYFPTHANSNPATAGTQRTEPATHDNKKKVQVIYKDLTNENLTKFSQKF